MKGHLRNHAQFAPLALAALLVIGNSVPAHAETCWQGLDACFRRAAAERTYWEAIFASLVCETDYLDCARRVIVGR